ncbi:MAG: biotin--[acetyl-CoA-carboxylase] ligase, partial [Lachnospiraceae bacterium]|nr:biotin--[acetyl-CoA-carboxylase] ligase [Lachnospiraceae bacterium]
MNISISEFDVIDSTNAEVERHLAAGEDEGFVAFAGEQTAGRGRSGHDWESPPNVSVATSIALFPTGVPIERIPRLT